MYYREKQKFCQVTKSYRAGIEMTKLIIVRHGQSEGNLLHRFAGQTDVPLTDLGRRQAAAVTEYLKNETIDAVYSSDLSRAYNTVRGSAEIRGLEVIPDKNLREINVGDWEFKFYDEIDANYHKQWELWRNDMSKCEPENGESVKALADRIVREIREIALKNDGKTVLIGTHATPIRVMETVWRGLPFEAIKDLEWVKNASVTRVDYFPDGSFELKAFNVYDFQGDMATGFPKTV